MFDNRNKSLIAETVFLHPGRKFYLRELAEESGVSASTVSRLIDELEEEGIVEVKKDMKMEIKARDDEKFRDLKKSYNLWRLSETGLLEKLEECFPEAIVLFGSYSRGEDRSGSDIDIALVNGREAGFDLEGYENELERVINIHNVNLDETDENFIETLANGIVLRGYLEI
ncbi:MAG: winged helix-turn-helix transcriptional regulator [Candidatus Nanohaloarchaea archaeon]